MIRNRPSVWSHVSGRLLVVVLSTVVIVTAGAGAYELIAVWQQDARELEAHASHVIDRLKKNLEYSLWQFARDDARQIVLQEVTSLDVRAVVVRDDRNEVYVGLLKGDGGAVRDYRPGLAADRELLATSYRAMTGDVYRGATRIGTVELYLTDQGLRADQRRRAVQIAGRLILFASTLAGVIFVSLRSIIVNPIAQLEAWVKAPAEAALPTQLAGSAYEIASLARTFAEMSARAHLAHAELERCVSERTAELQQANRSLSAANARLEEVDRLKSEFLATMSHELRTPLNSIIGFTGILCEGMAGPMTDEQARQLGMVQSSARHLLSLINDLLDLSRMEAGRLDLASEPFEFAQVVREVLESLRPAATRKQLVLRADPMSRPTEMVGDRQRCFQVLLNLASNAVKFTDRGEVCITVSVEGGRLSVAVSDTGIGIKPEHIGHLFEAFRQVDGSAKRIYEGTGLGLYVSRKLITLMGGEIAVESEYHKGSRFTFSLPLHASPRGGAEARE